MVKRILNIGVPSAFENSLFQLGRLLVVSIIAGFGTVQIAANAVANNLDSIGIIPGQAIGLGLIAVAGRCIGARGQRGRRALHQKAGGPGIRDRRHAEYPGDAVPAAAAEPLQSQRGIAGAGPAAGAHPRVQRAAALARQLSLPNALRAANDVRFTMAVSIASMAVWRLGLSYVLGVHFGMGALGVWIAMIADWVCRTGFCGAVCQRRLEEKKQRVKQIIYYIYNKKSPWPCGPGDFFGESAGGADQKAAVQMAYLAAVAKVDAKLLFQLVDAVDHGVFVYEHLLSGGQNALAAQKVGF